LTEDAFGARSPNFSAWEILLAVVVAVAAQLGGLFLLRTGGGTRVLADISDERSRPMSVSITPMLDDAPPLRLGAPPVPRKLPDRWMAPKPAEKPAPAPPSPTTPTKPLVSAKADTLDAGKAAPEHPREPFPLTDLAVTVPEAGPAPASTVVGSPDGIKEGTETDPLKAHATDLYKAQLTGWFKSRFSIRGKIPFDVLKDLRAGVRVNIGEDRTVTGFTIVEPSGNATFDAELNSALAAIVSSGADVPAPPPMYPDVLSKSQRIDFRCTIRSECE